MEAKLYEKYRTIPYSKALVKKVQQIIKNNS